MVARSSSLSWIAFFPFRRDGVRPHSIPYSYCLKRASVSWSLSSQSGFGLVSQSRGFCIEIDEPWPISTLRKGGVLYPPSNKR